MKTLPLLLAWLWTAIALAQPALAAEAKTIRVALQPTPMYAPIFVVKAKGWLEEAVKPLGATVQWSSFPAGPPINEAMAAGQQDIGFMGDTPALIARAAGQDTRVIALTATGPKSLAVMVRQDSPLTSPRDLKGKKVAVVKGSYAHHLLVLVLASAGLTTSDIDLINLPHADIATALASGDIEAGCFWEPLVTRLTENGTARVLADGTGIKQGDLFIIAVNAFASRNPDLTAAFLRAFERGREFIRDHPDEAAACITKDIGLPPDQVARLLAKLDFNPALTPQTTEELKKTEAFLRASGITKNPVDIAAFLDPRYLQAAGIE